MVGHADNIRVLPWARAVKNIDHKPDHILFAMARTAEREMKYQWVGPLFLDSVYLFQFKDNLTIYNSFERARHTDLIARENGSKTNRISFFFSHLLIQTLKGRTKVPLPRGN